jgi:hypothetical protein
LWIETVEKPEKLFREIERINAGYILLEEFTEFCKANNL